MSDFTISELLRRVERIVVVATVTQRDGDVAKVEWSEGVESDWLKIAQLGSKELPFWIPPDPGTQVVVLSPGGDTTKGIIYPGPFAGAFPAGNFVGEIVGEGDVVASDVSLTKHVHGGVMGGPASTEKPK